MTPSPRSYRPWSPMERFTAAVIVLGLLLFAASAGVELVAGIWAR